MSPTGDGSVSSSAAPVVPRWTQNHTLAPSGNTAAPERVAPMAQMPEPQQLPEPPQTAAVETPILPPLAVPTVRSPDGRFLLTSTSLTVQGQTFALREVERAELTPVSWILWYLLGGLGLAAVMIAFLQNWLRTGPAMLGMALTALLLAYGHRGTNRLRLHLLGRAAVNFALPGDPEPWHRLSRELNRRIQRVHDDAAAEAAAMLAAAELSSPPETTEFGLPSTEPA